MFKQSKYGCIKWKPPLLSTIPNLSKFKMSKEVTLLSRVKDMRWSQCIIDYIYPNTKIKVYDSQVTSMYFCVDWKHMYRT